MKIRPVAVESFHVDRQPDKHDKAWRSISEILWTNLIIKNLSSSTSST